MTAAACEYRTASRTSARSRVGVRLLTTSLLALATTALGACSYLIDVSEQQCATDDDCALVGSNGTCNGGVCMSDFGATGCPNGNCAGGSAPPSLPTLTCGETPCVNISDPVCFRDQCAAAHAVAPFQCAPGPAPDGQPVMLTLEVEEYTMNDRPLPGLVIKACKNTDVTCAAPVAQAADTEQIGGVQLQVPAAFEGYIEILTDITMPFILVFTKPLVAPVPPRLVRIASNETVAALAKVSGADVDLNKGIVILEAYDCQGTPQGGIHFEEGTGLGLPFYLLNSLPNLDSELTMYDERTGYAVGGFFNVPPGFGIFSAQVGVDGPRLVSHNAVVRERALTLVDIRP